MVKTPKDRYVSVRIGACGVTELGINRRLTVLKASSEARIEEIA